MRDERKRDFAWSGRRRDEMGVRGERTEGERTWNKKLIFSLQLCYSAILPVASIAKNLQYLGLTFSDVECFKA